MSTLKKNTYFISIGQVIKLSLALVLYSFACRFLGDEDFGRYSLATTIMFFVLLVDDFGINTWIVREVARDYKSAKKLFGTAAGLKITLISLSVLLLLAINVIMGYDSRTMIAIAIIAVYGILTSFVQLGTGIFRGFERMKFDTLIAIIDKVLIVGIGVSVLSAGLGLYWFSTAFVVAGIVGVIVVIVIIRKKFFKPDIVFNFNGSKRIFSGAVVFGISLFLTTLYNRVDMVMLSVMKAPEVWGWYSAAHRLLNFTNEIPLILMVATFPRFSRDSVASKDELSRVFTIGFKYMLILAIPLVPGVIILAEKIILFFSGDEFVNAIPALQILGVDAGLLFLNIFLAGLFGATNNQNKLVVIQILGLFTNVLLNLLLIPRHAHVGASVATVVTESVVFGCTFIYAITRIVKLNKTTFLPKSIISALLMVGVLLLLREVHVLICVVCAVAVYFGALLALRGVSIREIIDLKSFKS